MKVKSKLQSMHFFQTCSTNHSPNPTNSQVSITKRLTNTQYNPINSNQNPNPHLAHGTHTQVPFSSILTPSNLHTHEPRETHCPSEHQPSHPTRSRSISRGSRSTTSRSRTRTSRRSRARARARLRLDRCKSAAYNTRRVLRGILIKFFCCRGELREGFTVIDSICCFSMGKLEMVYEKR